jgi:RNA polymerase sigma-70 factor (ECF subfamily)
MNGLPATLQAMAPLSDEELVGLILDGDRAAFELLMRRHNQRLFRVARAVVPSSADAEDIVQETYLRAFANLARFEGRSSVVTWLSRIALHEALRWRRRQRRRGTGSSAVERAQSNQSGECPVEREEMRTTLSAALDSLPAAMRAVVMLRLVEGLSTRETAACLRLTESNVKVTLLRAKRLLTQRLEDEAVQHLRSHFAFAQERCDRIVAGVFARLDAR